MTSGFCMIYPRLKLLHRLLADDGAIFFSIDDNEAHILRSLLDEIWGRKILLPVQFGKKNITDARLRISDAHEYVICYAKKMKPF